MIDTVLRIGLRQSSNRTNGKRDSKDLHVVVIDLVTQSGFADLVHALKLIQRHGVPVRHDEPVKHDGEPVLAEVGNALYLAQCTGTLRNEQVLAIAGINVCSQHAIDGTGKGTIQAIGQNTFKDRPLEDPVLLAIGFVDLVVAPLDPTFCGRCRLLFAVRA